LQIVTKWTMSRGGNCKGIANPLNMAIFEGDEYVLPRWNMLIPSKDRVWILKSTSRGDQLSLKDRTDGRTCPLVLSMSDLLDIFFEYSLKIP
jgi:hypothetical protein